MDEQFCADVLSGEKALQVPPDLYINLELSWIDFNYRVLAQALNEHTPLLEQAKFSAIFSNNLDEFFMVRVASLKSQQEAGVATLSDDGRTAQEQLEAIQAKLRPLLELQQQHYRHSLKNQLAEYGALLSDYANLNSQQRQWVDDTFRSAIFPELTPLAVDPSHPFPFLSNLSLNVAVLVRDPNTG
ncbi:MAG: RNA degradosome polyphosphate kinase, partial [Cyanobium sp.]